MWGFPGPPCVLLMCPEAALQSECCHGEPQQQEAPWPSALRSSCCAGPQQPQLLSSSVLGKRCQDLLTQLYLQWPELRVPVPEGLLHSEGAASSSTCKVRGWGAQMVPRGCPGLLLCF